MSDQNCRFCEIISRKNLLASNESAVAFLFLRGILLSFPGDMNLIISPCPLKEVQDVIQLVRARKELLAEQYAPDGINIGKLPGKPWTRLMFI